MTLKAGGRDLDQLLRQMQPILDEEELVFCSLPSHQAQEYLPISQGHYVEQEGTTVILARHLADLADLPYQLVFKRITLAVYSSLDAVGFLARITEVLAAQGISVNVVSAFYHDHLYILQDQAKSALDILKRWQKSLADEEGGPSSARQE